MNEKNNQTSYPKQRKSYEILNFKKWGYVGRRKYDMKKFMNMCQCMMKIREEEKEVRKKSLITK